MAVQPLAGEEWGAPADTLGGEDGGGEPGGPKAGDDKDRRRTGRVVAVLSREERHYVATIEDDVAQLREGSTAALLAVPMDARLPKMRLRTRRGPALAGRRLVGQRLSGLPWQQLKGSYLPKVIFWFCRSTPLTTTTGPLKMRRRHVYIYIHIYIYIFFIFSCIQ